MFISQEVKTLGLSQVEAIAAAATSSAKGLLAITAEATDYSKKSVENGFALLEKFFAGPQARRNCPTSIRFRQSGI